MADQLNEAIKRTASMFPEAYMFVDPDLDRRGSK